MNWVKNMKLSVPSTIKQDSLLLTVLITKLIGMLFFKFLKQKQHNSEGEKRSMLQKGFWNKSENGYEFLVQSLSHVRLFVTPWTAAHQAPLSSTPRVCSISCPLSWWCHQTISSSVTPSPFACNISQHQDLFRWVTSSYQVVKVLYLQLQHQSFPWIFRVDFL